MFSAGGFDGSTFHGDLSMATLARDPETNGVSCTWSPVAVSPRAPPPRTLHCSAVVGDAMYVFGGFHLRPRQAGAGIFGRAASAGGAMETVEYGNNVISRFRFSDSSWGDLQTRGAAPAARDGHSMVAHEGALYVFGGSAETTNFSDLFCLDVATLTWTPLPGQAAGRRLHSAVVFRDREGQACMLVFGGYDGSRYFNDLLSYNFSRGSWTAIAHRGDPPTPRYGHAAAMSPSGEFMFVHGGYGKGYPTDLFKLNVRSMTWSKVLLAPMGPENPLPTGRRCHSAVPVTLGDSTYILFVGGSTASSSLQEVLALRLLDTGDIPTSEQVKLRSDCGRSVLGLDLGRLLEDEKLCDAFFDVMFVVQDSKFKAHRAILAARSEVFCRQFLCGMEGSKPGSEITVTDCSAPGFGAFLKFLYTGTVPAIGDAQQESDTSKVQTVVELLGLADKYLLPHLKASCEESLLRGLSPGTAAALLFEADCHACSRLKRASLGFMVSHYKEISQSHADTLTCLSQSLLLEVMSELSNQR